MRLVLAAVLLAALLTACGNTTAPDPSRTRSTPAQPRALDTGAHTGAGAAAPAPLATIELVPPLEKYTEYVDRTVGRLPAQLNALRAAAADGDVEAAETAWLTAHVTYLRVGQDDASYGAFGDLGEQIDGVANGLPGTTRSARFTGFHRVELDLWRRHDTDAAAADTAKLIRYAKGLNPERIAADLPLQTLALDTWVLRAHEILEDALRDSLSQEDDYGSNTDLASLSADVVATREMLSVLTPLLRSRAPKIVPAATKKLNSVESAITAAGGADARRNLKVLPLRQRQALDESTGAAVETLAPISEVIQVTVAGS